MAKVELPLAVGDEQRRLPALTALYRATCAVLREDGYHHLAAVASTRDRITCWVLQEPVRSTSVRRSHGCNH